MEVKQRLMQFINYKNLNKNKFEKICGLGVGYVSNISRGLGESGYEKISNTFTELNMGWLLTGEGKMLKEELSNNNTIANVKGNNNILSSGDSNNITYHNLSECEKEVELLRMQIKHLEEKIVQKDVLLSEKERMIQMLINK